MGVRCDRRQRGSAGDSKDNGINAARATVATHITKTIAIVLQNGNMDLPWSYYGRTAGTSC